MDEYDRAMEKVKKYLKNKTPEQIKMDLIKCGWHEIESAPIPIYNMEVSKKIEDIKISTVEYDFKIQSMSKSNKRYVCGNIVQLSS